MTKLALLACLLLVGCERSLDRMELAPPYVARGRAWKSDAAGVCDTRKAPPWGEEDACTADDSCDCWERQIVMGKVEGHGKIVAWPEPDGTLSPDGFRAGQRVPWPPAESQP